MSFEEMMTETVRGAVAEALAELPAATGSPVVVESPPLFAQYAGVRKLFEGISKERLKKYVANGWVAVRKEGREGGPGAAEYCVEHIRRVYLAEAEGLKPRPYRSRSRGKRAKK